MPATISRLHARTHQRTGLRRLTLAAGVVTPEERKGTIINGQWRPATGDFASQPGGLGVYPAANAAVVDATLNGDFETNTTGWTNNAAGGVISRITTDSGFGAACLQTVNDGTGANQGPITSALTGLTAGNVYTVGVLAKSVSGATAIRVQIEWFTVLDVSISISTSDVTLTTAWQKFALTATAPALGVHAKISVINTAASAATYNVDGVQLDNGAVALPFDPANTRVAGRVQLPAEGIVTATQGWIVGRLIFGWGSTIPATATNALFSWVTDTPNRIVSNWNDATTLNLLRSTGTSATQTLAHAVGDHATVGMGWTATELTTDANGVTGTPAANATIPVITQTAIDIGNQAVQAVGREAADTFLWVLAGKGVRTAADIALTDSWGDGVPSLSKIARLCPGSYPTCLVPGTGDAILLPAYFEGAAQ